MDKSLTYESDDALLEALRKKDSAAFESLYRQYYRMVVKQVNDQGLPDEDAEDIFQEVLLVLVRKIHDTDFVLTAKLSTYLFAIARNLLLKRSGKQPFVQLDESIVKPLGVQPPETGPDEQEERINAVVGCLAQMEGDCRTLLLMSFYEKRSQVEIAEAMGYSESFVKVKKHRCLSYLRKQVKEHPFFKDD
ncbi:MAG: sigma-70 family RNA polymerase sigma factor [Saprospiraceae bacterium]